MVTQCTCNVIIYIYVEYVGTVNNVLGCVMDILSSNLSRNTNILKAFQRVIKILK